MKAAACQSPSCIKKIKYSKKRFSICRTEFLHPAMWHDHDIDFTRWLHSAMWHVAPESWHWIRQVAAPCNVAGGSAMNEPLNSPKCLPYWNSTSGFDFYTSPQSTRQGVGGCPTMPTPPPGYVLVHVQADISWLWAFNTWIWNRTTRELKNAWSISSSSFRKMTGSNTTKQLAS